MTFDVPNAKITVADSDTLMLEETCEFSAAVPTVVVLPAKAAGLTLTVTADGRMLMTFTCPALTTAKIPPLTEDMPDPNGLKTAQALYLEGVHIGQYRDPKIKPDYCWKKALQRDPGHIPSLLAMGEWEYRRGLYTEAESYTARGIDELTKYNKQPESGKAYYQMGLILSRMYRLDEAYEFFRKSAWNYDYKSAALTKAAEIAGQWQDHERMASLAADALRCNADNNLAGVYLQIARLKEGKTAEAEHGLTELLRRDPLDALASYIYAEYFGKTEEFYRGLHSDPSRTCMDIAEDLWNCGCDTEAKALLNGVTAPSTMLNYMRGEKNIGITGVYPSMLCELEVLQKTVAACPQDAQAHDLLGCILYHYRRYEEAAEHFQTALDCEPNDYLAYRNLAVAFYSHLGKRDEALQLLKQSLRLCPENRQLIFECVYVMAKNGVTPSERIAFILEYTGPDRKWDTLLELARAYNQAGQYENALELMLSYDFVPCEGGEHAVAEQYMTALHSMGRRALEEDKAEDALKLFKRAQILPESLGSGIWNIVLLVPHQYYEGLCLEKLGRTQEAYALYDKILSLIVDYFTDMHVPSLPYYKALCCIRRGNRLQARAILDEAEKKWKRNIRTEDAGFFSTTPFFIPYIDDAPRMRRAYYSYLLSLVCEAMGKKTEAAQYRAECAKADPYMLRYYAGSSEGTL